jgi:hypothetical protein
MSSGPQSAGRRHRAGLAWPADVRAAIVFLVLAAVAAACGGAARAPDGTPGEAADTRAAVPRPVQREVHATLHDLPRVCRRGRAEAEPLRRMTGTLIGYYRRYPSGKYRFQIDDESATMLSVLLVVRQSLLRCDRSMARKVETVLPQRLRRALQDLDRRDRAPG